MMIDKRLIAMVPEAKRLILLKTLTSWISLLAGIVLWFGVAKILGEALEGGVTAESGIRAVVCICCIAVRFILTRVSSRLTHRISSAVKGSLRKEIYAKLRRLGGDYSDSFPTSEVVQLAGDGVEQLESYFCNYLPQLFYAMLAPVTLLIVFLPVAPAAAAALFICVPLIPAAIVAVQRIARRLLGKYWDAYASLGDSFLENLQGLTTLKVYSADGQRHEKMNEESENFRIITMKVLRMQLNSITIMDLVAYGGTALGSILCALKFASGGVGFVGALAMILLASEFFLAMRSLGSFFHVAMNGVAAGERMFRLFGLTERKGGDEAFREGDIEVKHLDFSYDGSRQALSDLNFVIPKGSFVSIAGKSGCGKSTLASLLTGARTGWKGEILIGGVPLKKISLPDLWRGVTVVSSGSYLFGGSVRETLREGGHDASEDEMKEALRRVSLLDFVESQGGLDMKLAERASNLSGGQRQRLALARALLKDSPVYIFDEATSNIDAESEEHIMQVIRSLRGSHTVILISHRLANVTGSDEILFLQRGKILERGTHEKLMAAGGEGYAALYRAQQELENYGKCAEPREEGGAAVRGKDRKNSGEKNGTAARKEEGTADRRDKKTSRGEKEAAVCEGAV